MRIPSQNRSYWSDKIARTSKRDEVAHEALAALGWEVAIFWECDLKDETAVVARLRDFLGESVTEKSQKVPPSTDSASVDTNATA